MTELQKILQSLDKNNSNNRLKNLLPIEKHYTYINWAIFDNDYLSLQEFYKLGSPLGGKTSEGTAPLIPMTYIPITNINFQMIVRILLKNGENINSEDLQGNTILTSYLQQFISNEKYIKNKLFLNNIYFLLEKGANANGTLFYSPLIQVMSLFKHKKIFNKLVDLLLSFGANINKHYVELSYKKNIYTTPNTIAKTLKYEFNLDVDKILKNCNSVELIQSLAVYHKIPFINKDENIVLKNVCKCIQDIRSKKNEYNEEKFMELRKSKRKTECSIDTSLSTGISFDSYSDDEIIYLHEKNPDLVYCFHTSEIPMLLGKGINPYNNKPLTNAFIDELTNNYRHIIPQTLEEILDNVFDTTDERITNEILLDKLSEYINSFNTYIDLNLILQFSVIEKSALYFIINRDYGIYVEQISRTGLSQEEYERQVFELVLCYLILIIRQYKNIPLVATKLSIFIDYISAAKEIVNLFPHSVKKSIKSGDYLYEFIENIKEIFTPNNIDKILELDSFVKEVDMSLWKFYSYDDKLYIVSSFFNKNIHEILTKTFDSPDYDLAIITAYIDLVVSQI